MSETPSPDSNIRWQSYSNTASADPPTVTSEQTATADTDDTRRQVDRRPESQEESYAALVDGATRADRHDRGLGSKLYGARSNEAMDDLRAGGVTPRREQIQRHVELDAANSRPLRYLIGEVCRIASTLDIPDQGRRRACELCHQMQASASTTWQPYALEAWAGAAVYTATREQDLYRPLEEIVAKVKTTVDEANVDDLERDVRACYVRFQDGLELAIPPVHPSDELSRLQTAVEQPVTGAVLERATTIITSYLEEGNTGSPAGIAAAALLAGLAEEHDFDGGQRQQVRRSLGDVADVAQRTITRHYEAFETTPASLGGPAAGPVATVEG
jgi:transcription initiation factor TFIIIB Brf1 subunit/transcription initiation factor TFIIB